MRVVIRIPRRGKHSLHSRGERRLRASRTLAFVFGLVSLFSFGICVWLWTLGLKLANPIGFGEGVLSRWQLWFGLAAGMQFLAFWLRDRARGLARLAQTRSSLGRRVA